MSEILPPPPDLPDPPTPATAGVKALSDGLAWLVIALIVGVAGFSVWGVTQYVTHSPLPQYERRGSDSTEVVLTADEPTAVVTVRSDFPLPPGAQRANDPDDPGTGTLEISVSPAGAVLIEPLEDQIQNHRFVTEGTFRVTGGEFSFKVSLIEPGPATIVVKAEAHSPSFNEGEPPPTLSFAVDTAFTTRALPATIYTGREAPDDPDSMSPPRWTVLRVSSDRVPDGTEIHALATEEELSARQSLAVYDYEWAGRRWSSHLKEDPWHLALPSECFAGPCEFEIQLLHVANFANNNSYAYRLDVVGAGPTNPFTVVETTKQPYVLTAEVKLEDLVIPPGSSETELLVTIPEKRQSAEAFALFDAQVALSVMLPDDGETDTRGRSQLEFDLHNQGVENPMVGVQISTDGILSAQRTSRPLPAVSGSKSYILRVRNDSISGDTLTGDAVVTLQLYSTVPFGPDDVLTIEAAS